MSLSGLGQGGATEPCLGLASPSSTPGPPLPAQLPERQGSLCVRRSACPSVSPSLSLTRTWGPRDLDGSAWARPASCPARARGPQAGRERATHMDFFSRFSRFVFRVL